MEERKEENTEEKRYKILTWSEFLPLGRVTEYPDRLFFSPDSSEKLLKEHFDPVFTHDSLTEELLEQIIERQKRVKKSPLLLVLDDCFPKLTELVEDARHHHIVLVQLTKVEKRALRKSKKSEKICRWCWGSDAKLNCAKCHEPWYCNETCMGKDRMHMYSCAYKKLIS